MKCNLYLEGSVTAFNSLGSRIHPDSIKPVYPRIREGNVDRNRSWRPQSQLSHEFAYLSL
jgi:hypothetical protein